MVIDVNSMRPKLSQKTGGLSGPAIRPVAVRAIYQVRSAFPEIPIVGMGGVVNGRDAFELVLAGANAVSVGTATFGDPTAIITIKNELEELCIQRGFASFSDAVSFAHRAEE
jgi:dihydroorotate dehydrogenase (NAD+) catalytic subunit